MFSRYSKVLDRYELFQIYLFTCGFSVKHQVDNYAFEVFELLYVLT